MANIAISALPVATSQAGADVLPIVQATTSTTKQLSVTNLFTSPTFVTPRWALPALGTLVLPAACMGTPTSCLHQHLNGVDHAGNRCGNRHQP
jgi:hypothetical protein